MKKLKHVIFDLDHTLWDFERNSNHILQSLFEKYELKDHLNTSFEAFKNKYHEITTKLWQKYDTKEINKEELRSQRIPAVFDHFNYQNPKLAIQLEEEYLRSCPDQPHLIQDGMEILEYLKTKYEIHLLTNGFKTIQYRKLKASGITNYFQNIVTSECSGFSKPDKEAFEYLLRKISIPAHNCIMIGDNEHSDIQGAYQIGMPSILYDPSEKITSSKATYNIKRLREIKKLI